MSRIIFLSMTVGLFGAMSFSHAAESDVLATANLKEIWFQDDELQDLAAVEAELQNEVYERGNDLDNLIRAKFRLINGDFKLAKFYLNRINDKKSRIFTIKQRYLATIAFIEEKFDLSLSYLSDKRFYNNSLFPQVCLLKLINFMAINDTKSILREKDSCMFYTLKTSRNDAFWLDTMIKLKTKDFQGVKKNLIGSLESTLSYDEMSKLWLKTGLYLNKEKELVDLASILPETSYQSKRLREILAFMHLRANTPKDTQIALSFVEDIDSANAENIKGSINLKNKEYELAFGHFRLALQKKQDSANSLERAIPLAWILNQWGDGLSMLESNTKKDIDPRNKKAVKIAFLIREKKYAEAQKELALLKLDFKNNPPSEINIMDGYLSLIMGASEKKFDKRKIEEASEAACRSFDGISCWISLQHTQWENLGKTIKRDDDIFSDKEMTIDALKEKQEIKPLKENTTVDQRDIEELDSSGVRIKVSH